MTNAERDKLYDVVWAGGEGLVPDRVTKVIGVWTPPNRLYNKTGKHSKANKVQVDKPEPTVEDVVKGD